MRRRGGQEAAGSGNWATHPAAGGRGERGGDQRRCFSASSTSKDARRPLICGCLPPRPASVPLASSTPKGQMECVIDLRFSRFQAACVPGVQRHQPVRQVLPLHGEPGHPGGVRAGGPRPHRGPRHHAGAPVVGTVPHPRLPPKRPAQGEAHRARRVHGGARSTTSPTTTRTHSTSAKGPLWKA